MVAMQLPKNPRNSDGRWDTGAWRFRSPAEEKDFNDRVRRLGAGASSVENVAKAYESAAFAEEDRIREAMGIKRPEYPPRRSFGWGGFAQYELTQAVRDYIAKLTERTERSGTIDLPSGPVTMTVHETRAPPKRKPHWADNLDGAS
jgi:hypothetical protein